MATGYSLQLLKELKFKQFFRSKMQKLKAGLDKVKNILISYIYIIKRLTINLL